MFRSAVVALVSSAVALSAAISAQSSSQNNEPASRGTATPVLLELFTSEGCSSCPPADDMLAALDRASEVDGAEIIALGEHVDYWDGQGWHDRFSSRQFTVRQQEFADHFKLRSPYTPELVVDGRVELVGNDPKALQRAIDQEAQTPKPEQVSLRWSDGKLDVKVTGSGSESASVMLAVTESGLTTNVKGGENGGRVLHHAAVVRRLSKIGQLKGAGFTWAAPVPANSKWNPQELKAVVFVQDEHTGAVLGAQSIAFPSHS